MSSTICNSSAVDAYLQELSNREVERTRRLKVENYRREIPFQVLKYIGIGLAMAIVLLAISKVINSTKVPGGFDIGAGGYGPKTPITSDGYSSDTIIDIDAILNSVKMPVAPPIVDTKVVRNYVIFDEVEFNGKVINEVVTGRNYADVNSDVDHSWCYVMNSTSPAGSIRLSLITIKDGERTDFELNQAEANKFGASLEEITRAKKECTI